MSGARLIKLVSPCPFSVKIVASIIWPGSYLFGDFCKGRKSSL